MKHIYLNLEDAIHTVIIKYTDIRSNSKLNKAMFTTREVESYAYRISLYYKENIV